MSNNYLNNQNLKGENVPVQYSDELIKEYIKCKKNPIYFIEKYTKIVSLDRGLITPKLYPKQKELILALHNNRKTIAMASRQSAKTTSIALYFCYYTIFNDNKVAGVLAHKAATAREILSRVKLAYENLPSWLQQGIKKWNEGSVWLENGSKVMASATSSSAIRGFSCNFLLLDEFAHVPENIAEEFFTSVYPTLSSGLTTKIAITSTPNGLNHFYKHWKDAENKLNGFHQILIHWTDVPWHTEESMKEQLSVLGEVKFSQEFDLNFLGSSNTLIDPKKLSALPFIPPIKVINNTSIYENPVPNNIYIITVDTGHGKGLDYSTLTVFDTTELPYRIVAKYRSNTVIPILYPEVIYNIGMKYNKACLVIENNESGQEVANILHYEYEYESMAWSTGGNIKVWIGDNPGIRTTKKSKSIGCSTLKELIEGDKLIINDHEIIHELSTFIQKRHSYAASEGKNDDLVMNLVLFAYFTTTEMYKDYADINIRQKLLEAREKQIENELTPFGFVNDGHDDEQFYTESEVWTLIR